MPTASQYLILAEFGVIVITALAGCKMAWTLASIEGRALKVAMGGIALAVVLYLICISTPYWVLVDIPGGAWRNATNGYVTSHHSGLWRICRVELHNNTTPVVEREYCRMIRLFPSKEEVAKDPEIDLVILDYSRSETAFAMISLALMLLGAFFSMYAYREPRYMFKRLAGAMHVITAGCLFVSIEVMRKSVEYERENLPKRHPPGSSINYGFSFGLAWVVLILYVFIAIIFFVFSAKRKGNKAVTEREAEENEPVHLGR